MGQAEGDDSREHRVDNTQITHDNNDRSSKTRTTESRPEVEGVKFPLGAKGDKDSDTSNSTDKTERIKQYG